MIGFILEKKRHGYIIRIIGWITFGLFWLTQIPHFFSIGDSFNAILCFLGFILFLYFTYHEYLNLKWREYLVPLNYIAGITAVGGLFYYLIERIEPLAKALIYIVALQSVWLFNLFGYNGSVNGFGYDLATHEYYLPIEGTEYNGLPISIILACTGIQSIAIFIGIIVVTKPNHALWKPWIKKFLNTPISNKIKKSKFHTILWSWKKRRMIKLLNMSDHSRFIRVFMYTVPVIYILNLFRNALIMYGHVNATLGPNTFDIAHNYLSKILSLTVLLVLVYLVFDLLPECRECIIGLMDLQYRLQPGVVKDGFVDIEKIDKLEDKIEKKEIKKLMKNNIKKNKVQNKKVNKKLDSLKK